jgi:hypothetical protein
MTHHDDARGLCALWTTRASLRSMLYPLLKSASSETAAENLLTV